MVLNDVAELTEKEKKSELRGFKCPPSMVRKMRDFVRAVRWQFHSFVADGDKLDCLYQTSLIYPAKTRRQ
jgi:hypothetical protein